MVTREHDTCLLDHLPGDGLEAGEREEDLAEAAAAVVQTLRRDVVLEVDLCSVAPYSKWFVENNYYHGLL